ncbi:hypothetical protein BDF22DRAFT_656215 [Syncephalis plumigaleata]|nr:hypothetical protein BDF22DRAFT_656215 [Syncephalis plumigaleata]
MPAAPAIHAKRNAAILITGTSSGIGHDAARHLAGMGFTVFAGARKQDDLDALASIAGVIPIRLDITSADDIANARTRVETWRADDPNRYLVGLVNNAGCGINTCVEEVAGQTMRDAYEVLVFGPINLTAALLPQLRETAMSSNIVPRIVNVVSTSVYISLPVIAVYSSAKLAFRRLTDGLRQELRAFNIRVIDITPGATKTAIFANAQDHRASTPLESVVQQHYDTLHAAWGTIQVETEGKAIQVDQVTNAIEHAICSPRPKIRYHLGMDTLTVRLTNAIISTALWDYIAIKLFASKGPGNQSIELAEYELHPLKDE